MRGDSFRWRSVRDDGGWIWRKDVSFDIYFEGCFFVSMVDIYIGIVSR